MDNACLETMDEKRDCRSNCQSMYLSGGWRNGQRKWSLIFVLEQKDLDYVDLSHSASAACWVYLSAAHNIS